MHNREKLSPKAERRKNGGSKMNFFFDFSASIFPPYQSLQKYLQVRIS